MTRYRCCCLAMALLIAGIFHSSITYAQRPAKEIRAAFDWFDTLEYPDVRTLPFIQVADGIWYNNDAGHPVTHHRYAFLLKDDGAEFTVFYPDLTTATLTKTPRDVTGATRIGYDKLDIKSWTKSSIASKNPIHRADGFEGNLEPAAQAFVLARACATGGDVPLACNLLNTMAGSCWGDNEFGNLTVTVELAQRMARASMWNTILKFDDLKVSRAELLKEYKLIVSRFPGTKYFKDAVQSVAVLISMVAEENEHARRSVKPEEALSNVEKVEELIYQLRDQKGHQSIDDGDCDIFADIRQEHSPAAKLVQMGFVAMPQLIEALNNNWFTRSIHYSRNSFYSHRVLQIREAALAIIERIASREFNVDQGGRLGPGARDAAAIPAVKAWWEKYKAMGEEATLAQAVSLGDENSPTQAKVLVTRYPSAALAAIRAGVRSTTKGYIAGELVNSAGALKGAEAVNFLYEQMTGSKHRTARISAAFCLQQRGDPRARPAMIEEWKNYKPAGGDDAWLDGQDGEQLITFLRKCGDLQAVEAITKYLDARSVDLRLKAVQVFMLGKFRTETAGRPGKVPGEMRSPHGRDVEHAVEALMAHELSDVSVWSGAFAVETVAFNQPRICEVAAYAIANLWPDRYQYQAGGSLFEQDAQRTRLLNIFLSSIGRNPVPLAKHPVIVRAPAAVTSAAIKSLISGTGAASKRADAQLRRLGLSALPAVEIALAKVDKRSPAHDCLNAMAVTLACTVRKVDVDPRIKSLSPQAAAMLASLQGKPLTSSQCIQVENLIASKLQNGLTEVHFIAYRDNDEAGFMVTAKLKEGRLGKANTAWSNWNYEIHVQADNVDIGKSGSGGFDSRSSRGPAYTLGGDNLPLDIHKALGSQPSHTVRIEFDLTRMN